MRKGAGIHYCTFFLCLRHGIIMVMMGGYSMNVQEVIQQLQALSNEKYKANVVKLGIPEAYSIGVSTTEVRALARRIKKDPELADALWKSGYHEARILAVLLYDPKKFSIDRSQEMMESVLSWDLCDHLCKNLLIKQKEYPMLIQKWCDASHTYEKRAAYTLIASAMIHDKQVKEEDIQEYLSMIKEYSKDEREHVKKAISWALREIGKKDMDHQEQALQLAYELKDSGNKSQSWIGKDAIKELEKLVKVEGRGRLIVSDSAMGKQKAS